MRLSGAVLMSLAAVLVAAQAPADGAGPPEQPPAQGGGPAEHGPAQGAGPTEHRPAQGAGPTEHRPAQSAGPTAKKAPLPDEVDVARLKPEMVVLHDGHGHYLALLPLREMEMTFYGDGRTFYQLRVYSNYSDASAGQSTRRFWSPISTDADIVLDTGSSWSVHCSDRVTPMVALDERETREVLARARFMKPFWKRQALALARDNRGVYYYVDMIRDDRPAAERERDPNPPRGYRFYIGRKGRMKEQRLSDAVEDSKGVVLSIKGGDLSLDFSAKTALFTSGKSKTQLIYLPVEDNTMLIYRDLGLYQKLVIPCDDM